jgi:predicted dehydrogenase
MMNRREFVSTATKGMAVVAAMPTMRVLGANDRVRVALLGCGDRGQEVLKGAFNTPGVEVVAGADIYSRRRDQMKAAYPGIRMYDDPLKLLDDKNVDAIINATPLHLHEKYFLATLAAGKDLYSEKTMTYNIAEAKACVKAAQASKQIVQVGLQHESEGGLADIKSWVNDGKLGKLTMVEAWMSRNTPKGHGQWVRPVPSDCTPDNVNWNLFLGNRPKKAFDPKQFINWRLWWEYSGGNITENMIHQIAYIGSALDLDVPVAAYMAGGVFSEKDGRQVPDTIAVTLEYANDLTVLWQSTFSNARYGLGEHFLGSDGTIEHVSGSTGMVTGSRSGGVHFMPEKLNMPNGEVLESKSQGVSHMANWIQCIRDRNHATNCPVELGYKSAVACHMANLAYRQKRRVTFEEAEKMKPDALWA